MRIRTTLGRVLVSVAATVAVLGGLASPASAGTPYSTWCSDGIGFLEIPILTSPITLAAEVNRAPGGNIQQLQLCYSTTAYGVPGGVIGGNVLIRYDITTNPATFRLTVQCNPDSGISVGPITCFEQVLVVPLPGPLPTAGVAPRCLLTIGGVCQLLAPIPWVQLQPVLVVSGTLGTFTLPPAMCIDWPGGTCP